MIRDGILNINKPQNMTSAQVVGAVRRILDVKKVGHTGTLDPMATGVLPICIGKATRIMDYLNFDYKTYECTLRLGLITDTLDIWGNVLEERPVNVTSEDVICAFDKYRGHITQLPPMYSAVRIQGKHLYEYARKGEKPPEEIKQRKVFIKELTVDSMDLSRGEVTFTVVCSKGTYIRTICQDVGEDLQCGAVMVSLSRTATGAFKVENSISLVDLEKNGWDYLLPTDFPLVNFGKVIVNKYDAQRFIDGIHISKETCLYIEEPKPIDEGLRDFVDVSLLEAYNVYTENGEKLIYLGVAYYNKKYKKLSADKVFYRRDENESIL